MPACEVCGREQDELTRIQVNNSSAEMEVCNNCENHGAPVNGGKTKSNDEEPNHDLHADYPERIEEGRKSEGYSISQLAKILSVSEERIRNVEDGEKVPEVGLVNKFENVLDISLSPTEESSQSWQERSEEKLRQYGEEERDYQ